MCVYFVLLRVKDDMQTYKTDAKIQTVFNFHEIVQIFQRYLIDWVFEKIRELTGKGSMGKAKR